VSQETINRSFDELASGLASGTLSRSKALKLMGAALLGGTLASIPGIAWGAKLKPGGARCKRNEQCASGQCVEGVCAATACGACPEPCVCVTDLRTGDQACGGEAIRFEPRCNACLRGEVCVASSTPGEVGCVAPCPITACGVCPEPCVCVTEFFSREQVCVQEAIRIELGDCNACDLLGGEVCVDTGTVGEVGCVAPCP
jgi:hypothetical protein